MSLSKGRHAFGQSVGDESEGLLAIRQFVFGSDVRFAWVPAIGSWTSHRPYP